MQYQRSLSLAFPLQVKYITHFAGTIIQATCQLPGPQSLSYRIIHINTFVKPFKKQVQRLKRLLRVKAARCT